MRQWVARLPIRGKLLLLAAIVACVALLISGAVLVYYAYDASEQALHHRLQTQARIMALSNSAAVAFEDEEAARNTLMALAGDTAIVGAEIRRADGSSFVEHAFAHADVEDLHTRSDLVRVSADILLDERIGSVHLFAERRELKALVTRAIAILALAALASLVVALLAASRLQRIISDPILALANTAGAVSRTRDYTLRVKAAGQDEVGKLVEAFNDMLAQTDAQGAELRAYQAELEHKVEVRTLELASALKAAQAAAQAKADFLANMSHEIRTPMNGVIGMLDLLDAEGLDAQRRSMLETARHSAEALLGIINDVLDFSKIDAGKLTLEDIELELVPLAEEVCTLFARQAHAKGVEVTCLVEAGVPRLVRGDPVRLRQVLANLLGNAVKFTEQGEVSLTVRAGETRDGHVQIVVSIRDTGIGMTEQAVSRLFQSFTQADSSTTRKFGGTGLGLAITKRLIDAMQGTISVSSEPGKGSMFTVTLPMMVGSSGYALRPADLSAFRVLVVDDNATNRLVLQHYLEALRIDHRSAASACEGLQAVRSAQQAGEPFDLVILDYQMPGCDGLSFVRELRADARIAETKCLMLSSVGDRQLGAEDLQIAAWLNKPVRQSQLYSAIAMVTGVSAGWNAALSAADLTRSSRESEIRLDSRVLLVEDNVVNQQVALRMLAAFGLNPRVAVNGKEALEQVKAEPFDLVFMDCQMPVMDGYQASRAIREWERSAGRPRVPIIAMTANAMQGDRERCLEAGMDDYVSKPVTRDSLKAVLLRWLVEQIVPDSAPCEPVRGESDELLDRDAFDQLSELFDGNPGAVIDSYIEDAGAQIAFMEKAYKEADRALLGRAAHSLKSSSRSLGGRRVAQICEGIETLVRSDQTLESVAALLLKLREANDGLTAKLVVVRSDPARKTA